MSLSYLSVSMRLTKGFTARRLMLAALLPVLVACQNLQPRSVDDIEKGKLPAGVERTDRHATPAPAKTSPPARPVRSGRPAAPSESDRLQAQRELADQTAVLVFSAGMTSASGLAQDAELAMQFVASGSGDKNSVRVDLGCAQARCMPRVLQPGTDKTQVQAALAVVRLNPGQWQLQAVRLTDATAGAVAVALEKPIKFEMRKGYATYLGAFTVTGHAQRGSRSKGQTARLPLLRSASVEQDMTRALTDFPETRGRKMLNLVQGISRPRPVN